MPAGTCATTLPFRRTSYPAIPLSSVAGFHDTLKVPVFEGFRDAVGVPGALGGLLMTTCLVVKLPSAGGGGVAGRVGRGEGESRKLSPRRRPVSTIRWSRVSATSDLESASEANVVPNATVVVDGSSVVQLTTALVSPISVTATPEITGAVVSGRSGHGGDRAAEHGPFPTASREETVI